VKFNYVATSGHVIKMAATPLNGMHEMLTIATDDPVAWCICLSVDVPAPLGGSRSGLGAGTPEGQRNIVGY